MERHNTIHGEFSSSQGENLCERFQFKLYVLLEEGDGDLIRWHYREQGFEVLDRDRFVREVAAPQFGCLTWDSFAEVLSNYGFRTTRSPGLLQDWGQGSSCSSNVDEVFTHPSFRQGAVQSLVDVRFVGAPADTGGTAPVIPLPRSPTLANRKKRSREQSIAAAGCASSGTSGKEKRRRTPQPPRPLDERELTTGAWVAPPGCVACGGETRPRASCSACGGEYHPRCLDPPLAVLPDKRWVCAFCPSLRPRPSGARPAACSSTSSSSSTAAEKCSTSTTRYAASATLVSSMLARLSVAANKGETLSRPTLDNDRLPARRLRNAAAGDGDGDEDEDEGGVRDMVGKVLAWAFKIECEGPLPVCLVCEEFGARVTCCECGFAFHLDCLEPPLASVPGNGWACCMCTEAPPCWSKRREAILKIAEVEFSEARVEESKKGPACSMCVSLAGIVQYCNACKAPFHPRCMDPPRTLKYADGYTCVDCRSPPTFDPVLPVLMDPSSDSRALRSGDDHHDRKALLSVRAVETPKPVCQQRKEKKESKKPAALDDNPADGSGSQTNDQTRKLPRKATTGSSASVVAGPASTPGAASPTLDFPGFPRGYFATDGDGRARRPPPAVQRQPSSSSACCAAGMACSLAGGKLNTCGECGNSYHSRCLSRSRTRTASSVWRCDRCRQDDLDSRLFTPPSA